MHIIISAEDENLCDSRGEEYLILQLLLVQIWGRIKWELLHGWWLTNGPIYHVTTLPELELRGIIIMLLIHPKLYTSSDGEEEEDRAVI